MKNFEEGQLQTMYMYVEFSLQKLANSSHCSEGAEAPLTPLEINPGHALGLFFLFSSVVAKC